LLLDEPLHELVGREVALVARDLCQLVDQRSNPAFLLKGQLDGCDNISEVDLRGAHSGNDNRGILIDKVLDHHHRVIAFL